jgi:hypothetical protein
MPGIISDPPKAPGAIFEVCPASLRTPKAYTESPNVATICTMVSQQYEKFLFQQSRKFLLKTGKLAG